MTQTTTEHGQTTLPTLRPQAPARAETAPRTSFRDIHGVTHAGKRRTRNEDHYMGSWALAREKVR